MPASTRLCVQDTGSLTIVQNLRSTLDHLVHQLYMQEPGNSLPGKHIYFPIAESQKEYDEIKGRKTRGISEQAKDLIDKVRPYKGGNDKLWQIQELNNIDKHRTLITRSLGTVSNGVDFGVLGVHSLRRLLPDQEIPMIHAIFRPAGRQPLITTGSPLFIDVPDAEPVSGMPFDFRILLNELGVIEGEPLMEALQSMIDAVEALVPIFSPIFSSPAVAPEQSL